MGSGKMPGNEISGGSGSFEEVAKESLHEVPHADVGDDMSLDKFDSFFKNMSRDLDSFSLLNTTPRSATSVASTQLYAPNDEVIEPQPDHCMVIVELMLIQSNGFACIWDTGTSCHQIFKNHRVGVHGV